MGRGSRSSRAAQAPRDVARRVHRRGRLRARAGADGLDEAPHHAVGDGRGRRRLRRAQHVVGRRHRRQYVAHRDAPDSARRGAAARGAGDRILLSVVSVAALAIKVNWLAAALLALTIAIYMPLYTMVLKRSTSLNIVIGGAAGALPPVIGWAAATGSLSAGPIAMFLIIFLWTPPHFWALALCRSGDYERVGVPMLPNVVGAGATCRQIVAYSVLLVAASFGPLAHSWRRPRSMARSRLSPARCSCGARFALYRLRDGDESARRKAAMALFGYLDPLPVRPVRGDAGRGRVAMAAFRRAAFKCGSPDVRAQSTRPQRANMAELNPNSEAAQLDRACRPRRGGRVLMYVGFVLKIAQHGLTPA